MRFAALILLFVPALLCAASAAQPNVIVIVADDMGYSDPGCFGGEIATPALDRLAAEGVRLTHFHNGGMCVVSRASLLTGQWWPRALPAFKETPLLSEKLHAAGYRTALIGKWHLAGDPMDRGFDHFFGFLAGFADHFSGAPSYRLDRAPFTDFGQNFYSSEAFTDSAIAFTAAGKPDKPFFLYLSFQAPHNPLQAPRPDILKYRGKYLAGWQVVREARFAKQKKLGIVPATAELPDYPENLPDWESLTDAQRDLEDLRMATYAAMVEGLDRGVGRLLAALEQRGQAENTLILFLSDNGADSFSVVDQAMLKKGLLPGDRGSNWQPGTGAAYAFVTPWRLYKISQHAGGVTTGGIAWWPGRTGKPGRISSSPLHVVDVLPTVLEAAGQPSASVAGESFLPLLTGESWKRQDPLFFQYMDNRAIRTDEWTLTEVDGAGWELYHTPDDPLETDDVAGTNAAVVADLGAQWLRWWRQESGKPDYTPEPTRGSQHYHPQGDRGTGDKYVPSAMPEALSGQYPLPR